MIESFSRMVFEEAWTRSYDDDDIDCHGIATVGLLFPDESLVRATSRAAERSHFGSLLVYFSVLCLLSSPAWYCVYSAGSLWRCFRRHW